MKRAALVVAMAVLATSAALARAEIAQEGNLRLKVDGQLSPKKLPRKGVAPIAVSVGGEITTTDESLPPQLEVDADRAQPPRQASTTPGLPTCEYSKIQPGSSTRALAECRSSLVGRGSFSASITLAGQEPYPTGGELLVFNSRQGGKPVLYGHIYSSKPFATSFVIVFEIQRLDKGAYGTALNAPLPKAMDAWGRLTGLQMSLERRYYKGEPRSFVSAGCPAPQGFNLTSFKLARTAFSFADGKELSAVISDTCRAGG